MELDARLRAIEKYHRSYGEDMRGIYGSIEETKGRVTSVEKLLLLHDQEIQPAIERRRQWREDKRVIIRHVGIMIICGAGGWLGLIFSGGFRKWVLEQLAR